MNDTVPIFRLATKNDVRELAELRWRLHTNDLETLNCHERKVFTDTFIKQFSAKEFREYRHWVIDVEGRIVGMMSLKVVRQLPAPKRLKGCWGYLTNCYVMPEYRNQGFGSKLVGNIQAWCKEHGLELVVVWPSDRSYRFYKQSGFDRYPDPLVLKLLTEV